MEWSFEAKLWLWKSDAGWHFVTLPFDIADEILDLTEGNRGGFGSVKVDVTCGKSFWKTSIFQHTESKSFILPIKKSVRSDNKLGEGSTAEFTLRVLMQ
jgi:hypothetical protein